MKARILTAVSVLILTLGGVSAFVQETKHSTIAAAYMSLRPSSFSPRACSGDMYATLP